MQVRSIAIIALLFANGAWAQNNANQQQNAAGGSATFSGGFFKHDVFKNGKKGMEIHHKIRVEGMKGRKMEVACYFYRKAGDALVDTNGVYKTKNGKVSVGDFSDVRYDDATFKDYTLFIPHKELHAGTGKHELKTKCEAFDSGSSIGKSGWLSFTLRAGAAVPKKAKFGKGSLKHDQYRNNVKGIEVHHPVQVQAMKDQELEVTCFFNFKDGRKLKDQNQRYYTKSGNVSSMDKVQVKFADATFKDFTIFLPYDELHLTPGRYDLKTQCKAFHQGTEIGASDWLHFWYKKN